MGVNLFKLSQFGVKTCSRVCGSADKIFNSKCNLTCIKIRSHIGTMRINFTQSTQLCSKTCT